MIMEFSGRLHRMNRYAATLLLILPFAAMADDAPAPEPRRYEGILSVGYSYGGDTLPDTHDHKCDKRGRLGAKPREL